MRERSFITNAEAEKLLPSDITNTVATWVAAQKEVFIKRAIYKKLGYFNVLEVAKNITVCIDGFGNEDYYYKSELILKFANPLIEMTIPGIIRVILTYWWDMRDGELSTSFANYTS